MSQDETKAGSELSGGLGTSLAFDDALRIARGCMDYYGGGYYGYEYGIYRHGIQTVINSLEAAKIKGMEDSQVRMLHRMGGS